MSIHFDSSAVLALAYREPGAHLVASAMPEAEICSVNAAEVLRVLELDLGGVGKALATFESLNLAIIDFTADDAREVVRMSELAPALSLGDCACLAVAKRRGADRVLTADRLWARYDVGVPVQVIR